MNNKNQQNDISEAATTRIMTERLIAMIDYKFESVTSELQLLKSEVQASL